MELVVLFGIAALLLFGPRRHGRKLSHFEIAIGAVFLIWMAIAFGLGRLWQAVFGTIPQP